MEKNFSPQQNTPPQAPAQTTGAPHQKRVHLSLVTSLLVIALAIALIILGERILIDVNRLFNPGYERYGDGDVPYGYAPNELRELSIPTAHATVFPPPLPSYTAGLQSYETYRLLLHAAVIIPLFLLMFLIYYFFRFKKPRSPYKILSYAYITFAFYMIVRLLAELCLYLIKHLKTGGVYIVLIILITIFTVLITVVQKRLHAKSES